VTDPLWRQSRDVRHTFFRTADLADITRAYQAHRTSGLSPSALHTMGALGGSSGASTTVTWNLNVLENTTRSLLRKDDPSAEAAYDSNLQAALAKIDWQHYRSTVFAERFEAEYTLLTKTVMKAGFFGMWWIIFYDLTYNFQGNLLHPKIPDLIDRHPEPITTADIGHDEGRLLESFFHEVEKRASDDCAKPGLPRDTKDLLIELAKQAALVAAFGKDVADYIECEIARKEKERREAEKQVEEAREQLREAHPMEGAEDHVDDFDKNRDWISRTC
jgi:hypothetical protein